MALVPADRHQICLKLMNVLDRFLAEPLHGIGVKKDAVIAAKPTDFGNGLQRSGFIVGCHDRHELSLRSNERA